MRLLRNLLLLMLLLPACAGAREIPIKDFYRDSKYTTISLAPDGKHIAITVPQEDRTLLAILRVSDNALVGKFDYGVDRHFLQVIWANNERIVFRLGFKTGRYDFLTGRADMYAANIDGTQRLDIPNGNFFQIVDTLRDDRSNILVQRSVEQATLSKLNIYNGRAIPVSSAPVDSGDFIVDHDARVRYVVGEMTDGSVRTLRRDGDKWTRVHEAKRSTGSYVPFGFTADNKRLYVLKNDGNKPASIVIEDPETGKETLLSSNPNVDPSGLLWSSDGKTLLGVRYVDGLPSTDFVAPEHPETKLLASLDRSFGDKAVSFFDTSDDGRYIGVETYSDSAPAEAYLFDRETGKAQYLLSARDWIKPADMAQTEAIEVRARDGLPIHAYLTTPRGVPAKDLPLIVFVHGGPHGVRDNWGFDPDVQLFANRGYAVLQVNYRGSGGYGDAFLRAGYRKWGTAMQDDLTDVVQSTIRQGKVDRDRICIYGASYGGFAALMSPAREPDLYKCTVGYVGVYSLPMMRQKGDIPGVESGRRFLEDVLPTSAAELQAQSPAYNVDKIKAPIMLVHGAKDVRVPIAQMNFLVSQLKAVGKTPEDIVVQAKEGHGFRDVANNVDLYTRMLAFFDRHIGAGAKKTTAAASSD